MVTSLRPEQARSRRLYETLYCARGEMENRIKECQLDLFADRTSARTMRANQLRLWFASMAYVLLCALRRIGLAHTRFARASCGSIRLKLLKIAALVRISVRRIKFAMASGCPYQREFQAAHAPIIRRRNVVAAARMSHTRKGSGIMTCLERRATKCETATHGRLGAISDSPADPVEHHLYELLVRVNARPSDFVDAGLRGGIGQHPRAGFRHVSHEYRLQSRAACPEQRQDRGLPRHPGEPVQEGIVRTEYHAGTQDRDALEGLLDEALSDPPGADIGRVRTGIGAQTRDMDQPLDPCPLRLPGDMQSSPSVDPVECRAVLLDVVADGIDHRSRALYRPCDRRLVPYIGVHQLDPAVRVEPPQEGGAVRMAHAHTHVVPCGGQVFHDPATEDPGSTEYRYSVGHH